MYLLYRAACRSVGFRNPPVTMIGIIWYFIQSGSRLFLTDDEIAVEGIGAARVDTGDQREELPVLLDIDIRGLVLGHDLIIDHLIIDILPVVVDGHRVPYLQLADIVKKDPADIIGMAGDGDIGIGLIDRQRGARQMRRAVCHDVLARAQIHGQIEVDRVGAEIAVDARQSVIAHSKSGGGVVRGIHRALMVDQPRVIRQTVAAERVEIIAEHDGGIRIADALLGDNVALFIDLALLPRLLEALGGNAGDALIGGTAV